MMEHINNIDLCATLCLAHSYIRTLVKLIHQYVLSLSLSHFMSHVLFFSYFYFFFFYYDFLLSHPLLMHIMSPIHHSWNWPGEMSPCFIIGIQTYMTEPAISPIFNTEGP